MEKPRRRHVPAFGEWNYNSSSSPDKPERGTTAVDWWYVREPETCSDIWFRYSPPPRKQPTPKKDRKPEAGDAGGVAFATPASSVTAEKLRHHGCGKGNAPAGRARARAFKDRGAVARTPAPLKSGGARRMVRPVDEDLYQVPPPDFTSGRPRRKRSLWMGCFGGLNCVA